MPDKQNMPLGLALKNAGLISQEQLQKALELQSKYTQMKLGEILVLQEGIRAKTIEFFVKKRQEILERGQQFPIGYYLKDASLLNNRQIEVILQEQKTSNEKFGTIAVKKGWIKQDTVDFFLDTLAFKTPKPMTLGMLEKYNENVLHLENKYANPSLILSRILAWTGGNPTLTKTICHIFANSDFNIPSGLEINAVDRFIEGSTIKKWQTSKVGTYIRWVKQNLVNNQKCDSYQLLKTYQQILLSGTINYQQTKEQDELLTLGVVAKEDNQLKIANLIYQQVFDGDWVADELKKISTKNSSNANSSTITEYVPVSSLEGVNDNLDDLHLESNNNNLNTSTDNSNDTNNSRSNVPEPLTKMSSLITLAAIALLIPLFLTINNYYSSLSKRDAEPESDYSTEVEELSEFCDRIDYLDSSSALSLISQIQISKQKLLASVSNNSEIFPDNCNVALDRLRVLAAPVLGKENRVLEAIKQLCQISPDSEVYVDAEVWLKRWYSSPVWGNETKFYLEELTKYDDSGCPAAHFTEYES